MISLKHLIHSYKPFLFQQPQVTIHPFQVPWFKLRWERSWVFQSVSACLTGHNSRSLVSLWIFLLVTANRLGSRDTLYSTWLSGPPLLILSRDQETSLVQKKLSFKLSQCFARPSPWQQKSHGWCSPWSWVGSGWLSGYSWDRISTVMNWKWLSPGTCHVNLSFLGSMLLYKGILNFGSVQL